MQIAQAGAADTAEWAALRAALWPEALAHEDDIARMLAEPQRFAGFLARDADGAAVGFAEAAIRHDYVNGCETSPVGFLEGLYVVPASRKHGVARALIGAVSAWARALGMTELGSDARLDNTASHAMHKALGFTETERIVAFRRLIG